MIIKHERERNIYWFQSFQTEFLWSAMGRTTDMRREKRPRSSDEPSEKAPLCSPLSPSLSYSRRDDFEEEEEEEEGA